MTARRIVIDTDLGVDDAAAILLALASPEFDVHALTLVAGNVPLDAATTSARKLRELVGRPELDIFAGSRGPLLRDQVFGKFAALGAFPDEVISAPTLPLSAGHAIDFIVDEALAAVSEGRKITLCTLGPLTNVALALAHGEEVQRGIERIVMMGGAFAALGNRVPWAEFNVYADPHSARIVFNAGVSLTMLPLDVTFQALMTESHLADLRRKAGRIGNVLARLIALHDRSDVKRFGRPGGPLHDPAVIAWLLAPDLFVSRPAVVGVECSGETPGHTYADFYGITSRPANAEVVTGLDAEGFFALMMDRLAVLSDR